MSSKLYDTDYYQWIEETARQIRERDFDRVDWDNLLEEIEDMGKSQRRALESLLIRLLEHLLKLAYWEGEKERSGNHWASEIVNFRALIAKRLQDSPSLIPAMETIYEEVYPVAIKSVSKLFPLPAGAKISLSEALDEDWFPDRVSRSG